MSMLKATFFGTDEIKIAQAGEDIIQTNLPQGEDSFSPRPKIFNFMNYTECQVSINGSDPILFMKGQGLYFQQMPMYIESFVILTEGTEYQLMGGF